MGANPSTSTEPAERDGSIELPDGRTLAYAELGAPAGAPVVVLDGPGSRGLARACARSAGDVGVRLIAPDRPGFGGSTPLPGRTIGSWADDLAQLAGALRIASFGILGQSGGTPYALAAAASRALQVRAVSLCGAVSPLRDEGALEGVEGQARTGFKLARRAPWLLRPMLTMTARQARRNPEKAAERMLRDLPPADAAVMREPASRELHVRATAEIMRHPDELVSELRALTEPWGFDLSEVRVPVAMWVGEKDVTHPPAMSHRLAERLPDARVQVVADSGTFGLMAHYDDALRFCA